MRQSSVEVEVTCPACSAVLAIEPADVSHRVYRDIAQVAESVYEIACAACHRTVDITDQVRYTRLQVAVDTRVIAEDRATQRSDRDPWGM